MGVASLEIIKVLLKVYRCPFAPSDPICPVGDVPTIICPLLVNEAPAVITVWVFVVGPVPLQPYDIL
jgi:hypothetical protein